MRLDRGHGGRHLHPCAGGVEACLGSGTDCRAGSVDLGVAGHLQLGGVNNRNRRVHGSHSLRERVLERIIVCVSARMCVREDTHLAWSLCLCRRLLTASRGSGRCKATTTATACTMQEQKQRRECERGTRGRARAGDG